MGGRTSSPKARIKTGTYTGDGGATQAITGVGFQPAFLHIIPLVGQSSWAKSAEMGLNAKKMAAALSYTTDVIISLDSDGFTVGDGASNELNSVDTTYLYVAMRP